MLVIALYDLNNRPIKITPRISNSFYFLARRDTKNANEPMASSANDSGSGTLNVGVEKTGTATNDNIKKESNLRIRFTLKLKFKKIDSSCGIYR